MIEKKKIPAISFCNSSQHTHTNKIRKKTVNERNEMLKEVGKWNKKMFFNFKIIGSNFKFVFAFIYYLSELIAFPMTENKQISRKKKSKFLK